MRTFSVFFLEFYHHHSLQESHLQNPRKETISCHQSAVCTNFHFHLKNRSCLSKEYTFRNKQHESQLLRDKSVFQLSRLYHSQGINITNITNRNQSTGSDTFLGQCFKCRNGVFKFDAVQRGATLLNSTCHLVFQGAPRFQHGEDVIV